MPGTRAYWSLSSFYLCYFAALGVFTPFFARWLDAKGLSGLAIGSVMAMWYLSRIFAPPAWSMLCAGSSVPLRWLQFGCVAMALSFAGFLLARDLWSLLLVMLAFGAFANAILPQFEAITLDRLGERRHRYGRIRLWGSLGFLLVAVGSGPLLDHHGIEALPWLTLPLLLATCIAALANGRIGRAVHVLPVPPLRDVLRRPEVRRFLFVVLLMHIGFGPFYVVYSLHLAANGYSDSAIGLLWGLGVVAEIVVFLLMPQIFRRWPTSTILLACLAASALRWLAVAMLPQSLPAMMLAQCVHALSFGAFHAACMQQVTVFFPGRLGQHGQGLIFGFSAGIGGVLGALMAGGLWQLAGGLGAFVAAALVCAGAFWLARRDMATVE